MRFKAEIIRFALLAVLGCVAGDARATNLPGLAMHGVPMLADGFKAFPYVNPDAPKGGRFTIGIIGSYDSLNPYIVRGEAVVGLRTYVYAPLMMRNMDEPFSLYPYIATGADVPDDRSAITFHLNPKARFSDGHALTADDVIFSLNLLKDKGWPNQRTHYAHVETTEKLDDYTVRFSFPNAHDHELPLLLALLPVLPKHAINPDTYDQATLEKPISAGPYIVSEAETGRSVTLKRIDDWWAKDLATTRGQFNFDELRFEFYRDENALFEAFKKGLVDVRAEGDPLKWANDYNFPAVRQGLIKKEEISSSLPRPLQAYVFNTRRAPLSDKRVRNALLMLFDFEWMNKNLFNNAYERTQSYFYGSELSSFHSKATPLEQDVLDKAGAVLPPALIDGTWQLPQSDATGHDRMMRQNALKLFAEAGYAPRDGRLVNQTTGAPLNLQIMVETPDQERIMLAWSKSLESVGIHADLRQVDSAQAERRRQSFDYDITFWNYISSLSPGNEQRIRWGSAAANQQGSVNMAGVQSPVVDKIIDRMLLAVTREELVATSRALDRVLLEGAYVIPLYNLPKQQIAHWTRIKLPATTCLCGSLIETWWHESDTPKTPSKDTP